MLFNLFKHRASDNNVTMCTEGDSTKVIVNGVTHIIPSGNVSVVNGVIYCDGKEYVNIDDGKDSIKVEIYANQVNNVSCGGNLEVHGNIGGRVHSHNINCVSVNSNNLGIDGNVNCENIQSDKINVTGNVVSNSICGNLHCNGNVIS